MYHKEHTKTGTRLQQSLLRAVKLLKDDSRSEFDVDSEFCYYQLKSQTEVQIFDDVKKCHLTTCFRLPPGTLIIGGVGGGRNQKSDKSSYSWKI